VQSSSPSIQDSASARPPGRLGGGRSGFPPQGFVPISWLICQSTPNTNCIERMTTEDRFSPRHEEYMRRYMASQGPLRAYVLSIVRDFHLMEDVLQEVAVAAWRSYDAYDPSRSFLAWVLGIARNKSIDVVRAKKPSVLLPEDMMNQLAEDASVVSEELIERRKALAGCIQKLTPTLRTILHLRLDEHLGVQEISSREGKSPDAVRKILARARAFLAECTGRTLTLRTG
jgi:RNA polymerase sigma-70 factor (ECF subfamily)